MIPSTALPFTSALTTLLLVHGLAGQQFASVPRQSLPTGGGSTVALADCDGDGALDLLTVRNGQNTLALNDGHGSFGNRTAAWLPAATHFTLALATGDVDGDGDTDLLCGNAWQQNRLYRNLGTRFVDDTVNHLPTATFGTQAMVLVDVDGDGDLDLVTGNQNDQNRLLRNDGTGTFTDETAALMPRDSDNTTALAAFDFDGDQDQDLVVANSYGPNRLLENDGSGRFREVPAARFPGGSGATFAVAVGDVDGDGRLDVLFGNGIGENRLLLNRASGTFTDATAQLPATNQDATFGVALVDVDEDGDLDAILANSFGQNRLWIQGGSGTFTDATARLPLVSDPTPGIAVGDVDCDGDPDLVFGRGGGSHLYLNRRRHVEAPGDARVGMPFTLRIAVDAGFATGTGTAVAVLAPGDRRGPLALPGLGKVFLDPAALLFLPTVSAPGPTGLADLTLNIPFDLRLRGLPFSVQAVARPTPRGDARVTNALGLFIR